MSLTVRHIRGRKGQALAEFALILPVIFLLIAGILEFGRAWNIKQAVTDAAREGARYTVIVDQDASHDIAYVKTKIQDRLSLASIPTTGPQTTITVTPAASFRCADATHGDPMTVEVSTKYRMGWVGALMSWVGGSSTITINSTATMRNEC